MSVPTSNRYAKSTSDPMRTKIITSKNRPIFLHYSCSEKMIAKCDLFQSDIISNVGVVSDRFSETDVWDTEL